MSATDEKVCQLPAKGMGVCQQHRCGGTHIHNKCSYLLLPSNHRAVPGRRYVDTWKGIPLPVKSHLGTLMVARLRQLDGITKDGVQGQGKPTGGHFHLHWQGQTTNSLDGTFHFPSRVVSRVPIFSHLEVFSQPTNPA